VEFIELFDALSCGTASDHDAVVPFGDLKGIELNWHQLLVANEYRGSFCALSTDALTLDSSGLAGPSVVSIFAPPRALNSQGIVVVDEYEMREKRRADACSLHIEQ